MGQTLVGTELDLERLLGNCCVRTVRGRQSEPALIRESPPGEQADRRVCSPVPPAADRTGDLTALQMSLV
ncbi:Leucine-Rich Repeat-Containing Protein 7 [Manis pentadactyla]|nr:Leucine-Rich Repeat-Containing Protein 7 [Manis pentadactyla]